MSSEKDPLRTELLRRRDAIPAEVRMAKDRLIRDRLFDLDEFKKAKCPLLFASFRSEVDTLAIIRTLLGSSKPVVLPKVDRAARQLMLYEIRDAAELGPGYMGIPEPLVVGEERLRTIGDVDVAVIPGAGFDPSGARIGYGGGYYDRLLAGIGTPIPLIAVAYEEQIDDAVPSEPHDVRVTHIVTDRRTIRCND